MADGSGHFPVVHSLVSPSALSELILKNYGLNRDIDCILITCGLNDSYLVRSGECRYIDRLYRMGHRAKEDIAFEIALLEHLKRAGLSVSVPVAKRTGGHITTVSAPEGVRHLVLFDYIPGDHPYDNKSAEAHQLGQLLAQIHNVSDTFRTDIPRSLVHDLDFLIDEPLRRVHTLLALRNREGRIDDLREAAAQLKQRIVMLAAQGLDWGLCHGDFGPSNVHLDGDHMTAFDFDHCGLGWRASDLATLRLFYNEEYQSQQWSTVLDGYAKVRPLPPLELEAIPLFVSVRALWRLGLHSDAMFLSTWGFDQYTVSDVDYDIKLVTSIEM